MSRRRATFRIGRTLAATVLLIFGTLLTLEGVIYFWADSTVFSSGHFAALAVQAAKQPPVKTEISRLLVDQAVKAKPDLVTVRPLIETVIETVISTPIFRRILVPALTEMHRTVFDSGHHGVALDLSNGLTVAIGGLRSLNPQLAGQVPPDIKTGLIRFGQGGYTADLSQNLERAHTAMLLLGIFGVLMLVAAVAISHGRRTTIVGIGVAFSVWSLLLILALGVGRQVLVRQIDVDSTAAAAGSVYDTFISGLILWLWIVAVFGALAAAAASATLRTAGLRQQLEAIRLRLTRLPDSRWARMGYAAVGVAIGAALLLLPELTLSLMARATGLLVLYAGGTELLRLSGLAASSPAPVQHEVRTRAETARALHRSPLIRFAAIGALLIGLFVGGATLYFNRSSLSPEDVSADEGPQKCNGYVELCERPVNMVAFAATHNSQSAADVKGFYFPEQLHEISSQLDAGVRGLLIKSHYGIETKKGVLTDLSRETEQETQELGANLGLDGLQAVQRLQASFGQPQKNSSSDPYLCHGFCELGAVAMDDALTDVNNFLGRNPNEVVIIFFGDYVSPDDTESAFIRTGLIDSVYTHQAGAPWPTLRQMIDLDERVLVLAENSSEVPRPEWYHDGFSLFQDTPYAFNSAAALQADSSCAPNRGKPDSPLFLVNHWIQSQTPSQEDAKVVNSYDFLLGRVQRCRQERGRIPNLIAVDFAEIGDLRRVVATINGVGGGEQAALPGAIGTPGHGTPFPARPPTPHPSPVP